MKRTSFIGLLVAMVLVVAAAWAQPPLDPRDARAAGIVKVPRFYQTLALNKDGLSTAAADTSAAAAINWIYTSEWHNDGWYVEWGWDSTLTATNVPKILLQADFLYDANGWTSGWIGVDSVATVTTVSCTGWQSVPGWALGKSCPRYVALRSLSQFPAKKPYAVRFRVVTTASGGSTDTFTPWGYVGR